MAAPLIAVVNDDTAFLDLMTELLGEEGYETVICKESRDVHKLVRTKQPALVILDVRMEHPETGWSILEMLQLDRAIELSRATVRKEKQNLGWASLYNVLAIPVAAGVLYPRFGLLLRPEWSALLMSLSSIIVAVNAVLLKRVERQLQ